jgi:hypothetical protein
MKVYIRHNGGRTHGYNGKGGPFPILEDLPGYQAHHAPAGTPGGAGQHGGIYGSVPNRESMNMTIILGAGAGLMAAAGLYWLLGIMGRWTEKTGGRSAGYYPNSLSDPRD